MAYKRLCSGKTLGATLTLVILCSIHISAFNIPGRLHRPSLFRILEGIRKLIERIRIPFVDPGEAQLTVIGGEDARYQQWPWMASLQYFDNLDESYFHVCGAAILNDQWLVTAAHCVDENLYDDPGRNEPALYRVMLGGVNLYYPSNQTQFVALRTIIKHPLWRADAESGFPNDIALLQLAGSADLTRSNIGAIALPAREDSVYLQQKCWVTGWGLTHDSADYPPEVLQHGVTPVAENEVCVQRVPLPVLPTNICIGGSEQTRACEGDSGSPLSCTDGSRWTLAGVGSWSDVDCGDLSVYTRTSKYLNWISSLIA